MAETFPVNNVDCDYDLRFEDDGEYLDEAVTQETVEITVPGNSAKKRKRRTENFTAEDKKVLAKEIKKNPVIWDLADPQHFNINAVNLAWKKISAIMKRTIEECKCAWTSLKESQRYRKSKQKKSGSSGGVPVDEPHEIDWEFAEDLAFLPETSTKRKTFSTSCSTEVDASTAGPSNCRSNYSYQRNHEPLKTNKDDQLALAVESLIEHQKSLNSSMMAPMAPMAPKTLVHETVWANLERMLLKLPADDIDDAIFEMTRFLYEKVKKSNRSHNDDDD